MSSSPIRTFLIGSHIQSLLRAVRKSSVKVEQRKQAVRPEQDLIAGDHSYIGRPEKRCQVSISQHYEQCGVIENGKKFALYIENASLARLYDPEFEVPEVGCTCMWESCFGEAWLGMLLHA